MLMALLAGIGVPVQTGANMTPPQNWSLPPLVTAAFSCCSAATIMLTCVLVPRLPVPVFRMPSA